MATVVNGERIDSAEIEAEFERLRPHYEMHVREEEDGEPDLDRLREWAKENVVERAVVRQAAREMDADIPAEEVEKAFEEVKDRIGDADPEEVKADLELRLRIDRLLQENVADVPEPTEDELREQYDRHRDEFITPEMVRASHIVKHVDHPGQKKQAYEDIVALKMRLVGGEEFDELAGEDSDCPERAGDLGFFPRGQMVQEFEDVVFGMNVGEVSDVFETQFGYHIAKVYERRAARTAPFAQVKDDLARQLAEQRRQEAVEAFVDSLKEKATIEEVQDEGEAAESA